MFDDAAVYRISPDTAIVQSTDFFAPVVDDAYQFGAIAAANSLSDIYAMGAVPLFALNIVCFPTKKLPLSVLAEIIRGGADKASEAGIQILGGHSIDDPEPKYGMVVTGKIHPDRIVRNTGALPGDRLILTKPLGSGIITTGIKKGMVSARGVEKVVDVMSRLNREASEVMQETGVHAATDVTGFGLMGHLREMLSGEQLSATVHFKSIPILQEALELAEADIAPGGSRKNLKFLTPHLRPAEGITRKQLLLLCDAQTSGGLLMAIPPANAERTIKLLHQKPALVSAADIGYFTDEKGGNIRVE